MPVNPLPPQAYTKETLQKAYAWLLSQGPSVKEMASSQEMLISLYLKAQRDGDASLETPSIQNFKQELKSLAHLMGDLQPAPQAMGHTSAAAQHTQQMTSAASTVAATMPAPVATSADLKGLDAASLKAIEDVRTTLNLSSDTEALRALIALGHKHFRKIHS